MPLVPAFCDICGTAFSSGWNIENSTDIGFSNCQAGPCPACGGMGHIPGVILGALVLTVLPEAFRHGAGPVQQAVFGQVLIDPENLRMLLFGVALVTVMLYRPSGLWPDPRHRQEFNSR